MSTTRRRPGPDSTLEETRSVLITTALELVRERGVDIGFAHISLSDTIERAPVTRSTAYRSLADDELSPQTVLHREILSYLFGRHARSDTFTTIGDAIREELAGHADALNSGDVASRTAAMRAIIRVGANANYDLVINSPERAVLIAVYGSLRSSDSIDWRDHALIQGEKELTDLFSGLFDELLDLFKYRPRGSRTARQFAIAAASLLEGIAMRHGFNDEIVMVERPTGPEGAPQEWTLFAIALESLVIGMFEPTNPDDPFADLINH